MARCGGGADEGVRVCVTTPERSKKVAKLSFQPTKRRQVKARRVSAGKQKWNKVESRRDGTLVADTDSSALVVGFVWRGRSCPRSLTLCTPSAHYHRGCESRYFLRINGHPPGLSQACQMSYAISIISEWAVHSGTIAIADQAGHISVSD